MTKTLRGRAWRGPTQTGTGAKTLTKKQIANAKIGDLVKATDPQARRTMAEPVVELIRHSGWHAIVLVTLTDGSVLHLTDRHPIWDVISGRFTEAIDLRAGDKIETDAGR